MSRVICKCSYCEVECRFETDRSTVGKPAYCPYDLGVAKWESIAVEPTDYIRQDVEQLIEKYEKEKDDHPAYYGGADNPYEAIKVIEANGWMEGFCLGNVHKYTVRKGEKPNEEALEDVRKARDYLDFYIDHLERSGQE